MPIVLTCVYCGMQYPEGTPPNGSQILTDHIKICPKHPLRAAEETISNLRQAMIGLIGAESQEELEAMEDILIKMPPSSRPDSIDDQSKAAALKAIRYLIETMPSPSESVRRCRVCGCTDADCRQCIERTGAPCSWVEPDLCSACVSADNGVKFQTKLS